MNKTEVLNVINNIPLTENERISFKMRLDEFKDDLVFNFFIPSDNHKDDGSYLLAIIHSGTCPYILTVREKTTHPVRLIKYLNLKEGRCTKHAALYVDHENFNYELVHDKQAGEIYDLIKEVDKGDGSKSFYLGHW